MVTHEDWIAELHRLNPAHCNTKEEGWYTCRELAIIWLMSERTTLRKLNLMIEQGRVETQFTNRPRTDGVVVAVNAYRIKETSK